MRLLIAILSVAALTASASAAVFTNSASADSFTRSNAPTLNYGAAGALSVSGANATNAMGVSNGVFDSFMRFNTAAMVAGFDTQLGANNWVINRAWLRLTEQATSANNLFNRGVGPFEIRWITNDVWTEGTGTPATPTTNGIAWNDATNLPNIASDLSLGVFTNTGTDTTQNFFLALPAGLVADLQAGGEVGFYFTALDAGTGFTFTSRTFMTNALRPVLLVSAVRPPGEITVNLSGSDVLLGGTNAAAGGTNIVLNSTNAATPLNQWTPVVTNVAFSNGIFTITLTNGFDTNAPAQQYFILQIQ